MAPDARAQPHFVFDGWAAPVDDPDDDDDAGWGLQPEPPPPPLRIRLDCLDYLCCFLIAFMVFLTVVLFRRFLLDDEYSVVNVDVLALRLTRMHMLVTKPSPAPSSWTALALLPTCPAVAPALSTPPVCYEWEKPAAAMVLPGSGSADSNWLSNEHGGDYMAAKKCFDSLVRDAAWTCDEQDNDYKATMKCFESLVRDATPLTPDDPPPT